MNPNKKSPPKRFQMRLATIVAGMLSLGVSLTIAHYIDTELRVTWVAVLMFPVLLFISGFVMLITETVCRWRDGDEWN